MERTIRTCRLEDMDALIGLLLRIRAPDALEQYPTPVDLQELLALEEIRDSTRLVRSGEGDLVGYVMLDPRFCNLYFEVDPSGDTSGLEATLLDWGIEQFRQFKQAGRIAAEDPLDMNCDEADQGRISLIESRGFAAQDLLTLHFRRSLTGPLPPVRLAEGFQLRAVAGEGEADAIVEIYHAAYGTQNMKREEILAGMRSPDYERELDLLAIAPNGGLAGLCSCGMDRALNRVLPCKTGWTDPVLVHPDYQGLGLAGAMIHRGWELLRERGAEVARLATSSHNTKAIAAFTRAGYREASRRRWYSKRNIP